MTRRHLCPRCHLRPVRAKGQGYCRPCRNLWDREHRRRYAEYSEAEKMRQRAGAAARRALRDGVLRREGCGVCRKRAEMHHPDYRFPLVVFWLCRRHHRDEHRLREEARHRCAFGFAGSVTIRGEG